jgi:hypothetical protein
VFLLVVNLKELKFEVDKLRGDDLIKIYYILFLLISILQTFYKLEVEIYYLVHSGVDIIETGWNRRLEKRM